MEMPLITDENMDVVIGWLYHQQVKDIAQIKWDNRKAQKIKDMDWHRAKVAEEAEWLEKWLGAWLVDILPLPRIELKAHIAALKAIAGNCQEKTDSWPGLPDGEGCENK